MLTGEAGNAKEILMTNVVEGGSGLIGGCFSDDNTCLNLAFTYHLISYCVFAFSFLESYRISKFLLYCMDF